MNYEKSQHEPETLSADEQKLREMCRSLKKIDAPNDFDFKLKARIAAAPPADFQPRFGFAFRYALPALALILVLGLLAYNGGLLSSGNAPFVAGSDALPPPAAAPQAPPEVAVSNSAPSEIDRQAANRAAISDPELPKTPEKPQPQVAAYVPQKPKKGLSDGKKEPPGGGSTDSALRTAESIIPNINSNSIIQKPVNLQPSNPIPVKEILSINGINASFENGKWRVKSVTANGVGESSDIKENDIIEAIDDQPLSAETVFNKTVKGQIVIVTRNGEKLQIRLRNKQ